MVSYSITDEDSIYFHEDEYCQIEIIPEENYFEGSKVLEEHSVHEENNGFLSVYSRKPHTLKTIEKSITVHSFKELLEKYSLKTFKIVNSGYGRQIIHKPNIMAYGFENYVLFVEIHNSTIQNIWIMYSASLISKDVFPVQLEKALYEIGKKWNEEVIVRLSNLKLVEDYLQAI